MGLAAAALALGLACAPAADLPSETGRRDDGGGPPNVVVVLIDTLRADHTSLLGYRRDTTPHLRRIGADGLILRAHLVNAPWTKPSVASILTGLHPSAHGARIGHHRHSADRRIERLDEALLSLPEALHERGWATAAWMTNAHLRAEWGFDQGYDVYRFRQQPVGRGEMPAVDREGVDFTIELLRRTLDPAPSGGRPVFVWTHLMAVHQYESAPEHRGLFAGVGPGAPGAMAAREVAIDRQARHAWRVARYPDLRSVVDAYDDSVRSTDAEIGRLFDVVRHEVPNTVVVVTSDHGEELYDHGGFDHGATLYNELLWVPAVLWGPGVPAATEIAGLTDSIDLFPTLLQLATGETVPSPGPGLVLIGPSATGSGPGQVIEGKSDSFAERHALGRGLGFSLLRSDGLKLIVARGRRGGRTLERQLFADGQRPETEPLPLATHRQSLARSLQRIEELRARAVAYHAETVGQGTTGSADAEDLERLRSLGYVR